MSKFRKLTKREIERAGDLVWFILKSVPQREYHVQRILTEMGVTTFVPSEWRWHKQHRYQKAPKKTNYPAYKSVVFVGARSMAELPWWKFEQNHLILGCYTSAATNLPRRVDVDDIKQVMRASRTPLFELHDAQGDPLPEFEAGETVRITDGLLAGEVMTIAEVADGIARFYKDMIGKKVKIDVRFDDLETFQRVA